MDNLALNDRFTLNGLTTYNGFFIETCSHIASCYGEHYLLLKMSKLIT